MFDPIERRKMNYLNKIQNKLIIELIYNKKLFQNIKYNNKTYYTIENLIIHNDDITNIDNIINYIQSNMIEFTKELCDYIKCNIMLNIKNDNNKFIILFIKE